MNIESSKEPNFFLVASAFMLVFTVGLFILHFFKFQLDATILETHVRALDLESTHAQATLYFALLVLFAMLCAITLYFPGAMIAPDVKHFDKIIMVVVIAVAIVFGSWSRSFLSGLLLTIAALISIRGLLSIIDQDKRSKLFRGCQNLLNSNVLFWLVIASIGSYFVIFVLLPIATPLIVHNVLAFRSIDGHYSGSVLPGFELCCTEAGKAKFANYGAAIPLLTAFALKISSLFGISNTNLVWAVKLNQLIATVMICVLGCLTNKNNYPYVIALALGLTAFTLSNVGLAVGYPNQSGIRYIPALTALIILVLELRRTNLRIWLIASVGALAVILNPETGMATTVGYAVAVVLVKYNQKKPLASTVKAMSQFILVYVVVLSIGSNLILGMILKDATGGLFQFVVLFGAGGYGGMVDKPSAFASLIFLVTVATVLRSVWRARMGTLKTTDIYEAAIGAIILVWLMYYVNRMAEWNLWFELVLLVLMIAPRITFNDDCLLFRRSVQFGELSTIIVCLIGAQAASSAAQFIPLAKEEIQFQRVGCNEEDNLDGKCVPWLRGTNLDIQMKALTTRYSHADTLVLTALPTYARLRGFNEGFPWYSTMQIVHKNEVRKLVDWVNSHGPKYVIADDPDSEIALTSPELSNQTQSLIPLLNSYRKISKESGWVIFERDMGYSSEGVTLHPANPKE